MKKLWSGIAKLARNIRNKVTNTLDYPLPLDRPNRPEPARRSKHSDFPSKSMRRGVQMAIVRKQWASRMAWIMESIRQGLAIRSSFRERQLARRHVRAELRAVPNPLVALLPRSDTPLELCYVGGVSSIFCKPRHPAQSLWPKDKGQG